MEKIKNIIKKVCKGISENEIKQEFGIDLINTLNTIEPVEKIEIKDSKYNSEYIKKPRKSKRRANSFKKVNLKKMVRLDNEEKLNLYNSYLSTIQEYSNNNKTFSEHLTDLANMYNVSFSTARRICRKINK